MTRDACSGATATMVDRSSRLIAVYDGLLGGTMYTVSLRHEAGA